MNASASGHSWTDRRIVLLLAAVILVLVVAVTVLAPRDTQDDPRPTTYNTGPNGAKAAFLTLAAIGRQSSRWEQPLHDLDNVNATQTTLILAAPEYSPTEADALAAAVKRFLERGGRVLTTGPSGALLLPGGGVQPPSLYQFAPCKTSPGEGPLATAGSVFIAVSSKWAGTKDKQWKTVVSQRCGRDPVVIEESVGSGSAVWWTSASPLTNAELKTDAELRLLLLSIGERRTVLWDESLHEETPSLWSTARGLPLTWLSAQVLLLAALLVLSFSRRNGPLRSPVTLPRSSPTEFAVSMGDLYDKARATSAATEAAKRRLVRAITRDAGVPPAVIDPQAVAAALTERLGGDWTAVSDHLRQAAEVSAENLSGRSALTLSRALAEDAARIRMAAMGNARMRDPRIA